MKNYSGLGASQLGRFFSVQTNPKRAAELWLFCLQLEATIDTNIRLSLNFAEPRRKSFIKKKLKSCRLNIHSISQNHKLGKEGKKPPDCAAAGRFTDPKTLTRVGAEAGSRLATKRSQAQRSGVAHLATGHRGCCHEGGRGSQPSLGHPPSPGPTAPPTR